MATSLTLLPVETIDFIASHLDLQDLRSLRLVSKDVETKVTASRRFQSFCLRHNVGLRVSELQALGARLAEPGPQRYLEHLTITGVLLTTSGLERTIRAKTKAGSLKDPCGLRRDTIGNSLRLPRVPASEHDVADAKAQLESFRRRIEAGEADRATGRDVEALTNLLEAIKANTRGRGLKGLTLDLVVYRERTTPLSPAVGAPGRQVWTATQQTYSCVMRALSRAALMIEEIDVFSKAECCAVETYNLAALHPDIDFLCKVKTLQLCMSNRVLPLSPSMRTLETDIDDRGSQSTQLQLMRQETLPYTTMPQMLGSIARQRTQLLSQPVPETSDAERARLLGQSSNVNGLADLIFQSSSLEALHIWNYEVFNGHEVPRAILQSTQRAMLGRLADNVRLSSLRALSLRNMTIETGILLKILRNARHLKSLELREMTLAASDGQWFKTISAHLTSKTASFEQIYFDNLFQEQDDRRGYIACFTPGMNIGDCISSGESSQARRQRLRVPGYWDFNRPSANGYNAFELRRREDVLRGIDYWVNLGYIMGSPQNSEWMEQRRRLYSAG